MKPCKRNAESIAELAMGSLATEAADQLREHLRNCAGCREYFAQISQVTKTLSDTSVRTDIESSPVFHRTLLSRITAQRERPTRTSWQMLVPNWRIAFPALAVVAVLAAVLFRPPGPKTRQIAQNPIVAQPKVMNDLNPSVANYQKVANQSLDRLDDLIAKQSREHGPSVPLYRASTFLLDTAID
jgi:anti-sigma-K factor RskA